MYPSKGEGMFVPESLIFRSDSNGEDLEGYAGAGLYDSITMDATQTRKVDYGADRYAAELLATVERQAPAQADKGDAWLLHGQALPAMRLPPACHQCHPACVLAPGPLWQLRAASMLQLRQ